MPNTLSQRGFAPIVILVIIALMGAIGGTAYLRLHSNPTVQTSMQSSSESATPSASDATATPPKAAKKQTTTPTPTNEPGLSSTPSPTSVPTPTSAPIPTPTPTPTKKSYNWSGTNVNAAVSCYIGDTTFDVSFSGDVQQATGSDGIWTTLTGDGKIIITSYQSGSSTHIASNYNDQATSIRSQDPLSLKASNSYTYGYELKVYYAPYTDGIPTLTNQAGNVTFAIDCSK